MRDFYISHDYYFLKSSESLAMCEISTNFISTCGFNIDIPQNIFYGLWSSQRPPACMGVKLLTTLVDHFRISQPRLIFYSIFSALKNDR